MSMLIEAAIALTAASAGAAAGWCLGRRADRQANGQQGKSSPVAQEMAQDAARSREAAKELLTQVHGLTSKVASQVGEHNLRVQAINDQLAAGDMNDLQTISNAVTRLVEANAWMQQQLDSAESRLESQARLIESHVNEARTDALTGIANRRAFDEEMQACLEAHQTTGAPASLMMIDVDFFKKFNDTHGHKAGDEVLRHVARMLKNAAGERGIVCRYGGEEFGVIFPGLSAPSCVTLAEACRAAIGAERIHYDGKVLEVNASAGLSNFSKIDTPESVLERADEALYASKRGGRNCGHWHNGEAFVPFVETPTLPEPEPVQLTRASAVAPYKPADVRATVIMDPVTGLSTRDALRDDLQRRLAAMQRESQSLSLFVVRIERLAEWRELGGDEGQSTALRAVSQAVRGVTREMDHAARFETNSFAVALHGANLATAVEACHRLISSLRVARPKLAGVPTAIALSIGVTEAVPGDDASRMLLRAQAALNTVTTLGGNQIATHDGKDIRLVEEALLPA